MNQTGHRLLAKQTKENIMSHYILSSLTKLQYRTIGIVQRDSIAIGRGAKLLENLR